MRHSTAWVIFMSIFIADRVSGHFSRFLSELVAITTFTVATPDGWRRLDPVQSSFRLACLIASIAAVICVVAILTMAQLDLVSDLSNGLTIGLVLSTTISFTVGFLICWLNARQMQLLIQSHERFAQLSQTDALTGLHNRLGLYSNCVHLSTPYCVAFIDIDHFKSVNDSYGHLAGDMVISSVAKTIREGFDEAAHVARMGGEEFVVVHTLAPDRFLEQCEGVREKIATTTVHFQDLQISTTISIGVALRGNREIFEKVMHSADMALYEAKRGGRNRICSSGAKGGRQIIA